MITTVAVVKSLLNITDTTYDTVITALLPKVEWDLINYCNNKFLNTDISFSGTITPTVAAGPVYSFVCSDGGMDDVYFTTGDVLYCDGSVRNSNYFTSTAIADTSITVTEQVYSEAAATMTLYLASFPTELALYVARMVGYQVDKAKSAGLQSETIMSYSYSRTSPSSLDANYPAEIMRGLERYKTAKLGFGRKRQNYNDQRGNFLGGDL